VSDETRVRCLHCGENILDHARICPHCRVGALVNVVASGALDDRKRYALAKALLNASIPGLSHLTTIQAQLKQAPALLIRGVTQAEAAKVQEVAKASGVETALAPSTIAIASVRIPDTAADRHEEGTGRGALFRVLAMTAAVVAVFLGWPHVSKYFIADEPAPTGEKSASARPRSVTTATPTPDPAAAAMALQSVVSLKCGNTVGAGFFIDTDLVLTNAHVLCGEGNVVQVESIDSHRGLGKVEKLDTYLDLGLVRVQMPGGPRRPLPLADASAMAPGARIFLIGSPKGLAFTLHEGKVSRVGQPLLGLGYIQIDARVNPGNSGGPLLDEYGRVVGVVSMKVEGEGLGLALPINYAFDDPAHPFMTALPAWVPGASFAKFLEAAQASGEAAEAEMAQAMAKPVIVQVRGDAYGRPLILVARVARAEPGPEDFRLEFRSNKEVLCLRTARTARWNEELKPPALPPRVSAWLQERKFALRLYTTELSPGLSSCPAFRGRRVTVHFEGDPDEEPSPTAR
jgi:S1-C subfamily serine protease